MVRREQFVVANQPYGLAHGGDLVETPISRSCSLRLLSQHAQMSRVDRKLNPLLVGAVGIVIAWNGALFVRGSAGGRAGAHPARAGAAGSGRPGRGGDGAAGSEGCDVRAAGL